ncbi:hypothetical protein NST21_21845 [Peribacillus sp. FSL K6-1552]|uniref:hypothetical protein n=1 Tax=Peribacillus sp. FSL K6-1552 TaxID=2954514 RepID=UPI0030F9E8C7
MRNYPVMFLMLFISSIFGGLALNNIFENAMLIGVSLGMLFLIFALVSIGRRNRKQNIH